MIEFRNVTKIYGDTTVAVDNLSLTVNDGELLVLLGESGCGKTTTLKMINRLIEPTSGKIFIGEQDTGTIEPWKLRREIGYVFQDVGLFPHMTVSENVGIGLQLLKWDENKIRSRSEELLALTGLDPVQFADRKPAELSGGQRQRVGVARALAASPNILLMDEPFGALDPMRRDSLQNEFLNIRAKLGLTVVLVTHDMTEALLMADRIAVMERGRIVALDTPQRLMNAPGHPYVAALLETPTRHAQKLAALKAKQ